MYETATGAKAWYSNLISPRYLEKPYRQVVDDLSKAYPKFDVGALRTDWITTAEQGRPHQHVLHT